MQLCYASCQDDLEESRDAFISKFSEEPKRDDLTLLAPKQEDPTDQVSSLSIKLIEVAGIPLFTPRYCTDCCCCQQALTRSCLLKDGDIGACVSFRCLCFIQMKTRLV